MRLPFIKKVVEPLLLFEELVRRPPGARDFAVSDSLVLGFPIAHSPIRSFGRFSVKIRNSDLRQIFFSFPLSLIFSSFL